MSDPLLGSLDELRPEQEVKVRDLVKILKSTLIKFSVQTGFD